MGRPKGYPKRYHAGRPEVKDYKKCERDEKLKKKKITNGRQVK